MTKNSKTLVFKTLEIEGFGSITEPINFNLDSEGINMVVGSNGAGKTTVFNALYWCLYGKNLKGVNKADLQTWEEYRPDTWNGTRVKVNFTLDGDIYEIYRHIDYSGKTLGLKGGNALIITKNGEKLANELYKGDQQEYITQLLGCDFKVFTHTVLFGQNMSRFIVATPEDKRKVLEGIFDIAYIEKAQADAKADVTKYSSEANEHNIEYNKAKVEIEKKELQLNLETQKLEMFETNKLKTLNSIQESIASVKADLESNQTRLKEYADEISTLQPTVDSFENLTVKRLELERLLDLETKVESNLASEIVKLEKEFNSYELFFNGSCKRCGVDFEKFKDDAYEAKVVEYQLELAQLKDKKAKTTENVYKHKFDLAELKTTEKSADTHKQSFERIKQHFNSVKETIDLKTKELYVLQEKYEKVLKEELVVSLDSLEREINELKIKKASLEPIISELEKKISRIDYWASTGFTSKGLKGYFFDSMLKSLNTYVRKYADIIGFGVELTVDLSSASKGIQVYVKKGDVIVNYASLSGGEKHKVDLCIAFGLHDIASSALSRKIPLLVLDEVFECIDTETGLDQVMELIRLKSFEASVFIITPNSYLEFSGARVIRI